MNFMFETNTTMERFKYALAEFGYVAEWYAQNSKQNDLLVSPMADVVEYYAIKTSPNHLGKIRTVKELNCDSASCIVAEFNKFNTTSNYIVIYSVVKENHSFYTVNKFYLLDNLIDEHSLHFELVKKIVTRSNSSALIYRFVP